MDILQYSADLLFQHKVCELPGIGRFRLQYFAAVPEPANGLIQPPKDDIFFEELTEGVSLRMIRFIAQRENIPEPQASAAFEQCIFHLKLQLAEGNAVHIPFIGTIQRDLQGKTSFTAVELSPQSWKAVTAVRLSLPDIQTLQETGISPEESISDPLAGPSSRINQLFPFSLWWMLPVLIFLTLIGMVLLLRDCSRTNSQGSGKNTPSRAVSPGLPVRQNPVKKTSLPGNQSIPIPKIPDTISYNIVFASYADRARAARIFLRIRHWGHPVVLLGKTGPPYLLAVPFRSVAADTLGNLQVVRNAYGPSAYILH